MSYVVNINLFLLCIGLLSNKPSDNNSSHLQSLPVSQQGTTSSDIAVTFTQDEGIDCAFTKLSASVTTMIENSVTNFALLQRACIEKANSPKILKSNEIIPLINAAKTFQDLCTMLANTTYWHFLDIRMMEALATASMIPGAQRTMENFKRTFFDMKLSEVAPYIPVIPLKSRVDYTYFEETLDEDPTDFTIGDLHKHRFYLETEVLNIGSNTLTIYRIIVGSIHIIWQIHYDDVHQATISINKYYSKSLIQKCSINHLSFPAMIMWKGLPILWYGQEVGKIGPFVESLKDLVQEKPYTLLQPQLWWSIVKPDDAVKIYSGHAQQQYFKWNYLHPNFKDEFIFGIRDSVTRKWVWFVRSFTYTITIRGTLLPSVFLLQTGLGIGYENDHELWNMVQKEMLRRIVVQNGFNQAIIQEMQPRALSVAKPLFVFSLWMYTFPNDYLKSPISPILPYDSPKTVGLRKITSKDIPKAFALTNQYTSKFTVRQVFETEKEFSHYFLCPEMPGFVITYVVTDPIDDDNITDMFSLRIDKMGRIKIAVVIAIVNAKSPIKQFITDILVCAKKEKVMRLVTPQYGIDHQIFESLSLSLTGNAHVFMYNYRHPEVQENSICLFSHFL